MRQFLVLLVVFATGWWARGPAGPERAAAAGPPDFAQAIERADPAVVRVTTRTSRRANASRDEGVGAGFAVDPAGWIVTSLHVLRGAQRVTVTVPRLGTFEARIVGRDPSTDVALLKIPVSNLARLPVGKPAGLRRGQWVVAGGSPYDLPNSWSVGIVSATGRSNIGVGARAVRDYIQTDAAANLGNSGGPLLDAGGRVVGMMTAILSRTGGHQGVAFAVPVDLVLRAVERLRRSGGTAAAPPSLGLRVRPRPGVGGAPSGLEVTAFDASSSARDAGLAVGDVILVADGRVMARGADLQRLVSERRRGDIVRLTVQRGRRRFEVRATLR